MNTTHLKYVLEVAKIGSISKAAENLYMNQPQLSKAIRDLENSIGGPIFKRTSKGIITTPKGDEFLMYARNILESTKALENLYKTNVNDSIRLSASVARASYITTALYNYLESVRSYPMIKSEYNETNSQSVILNVASGESNIGIVRFNTLYEQQFMQYINEKDLKYRPLYEFECNVLVSKNSPLTVETLITDELLSSHAKVMYGDNTVPHLPVSKLAQLMTEKEQKKSIIVYDRKTLYDILSRFEQSYSLCSPVTTDILEDYSLVERKCSLTNNRCKDVLVYRYNHVFTDEEKNFIKFVEKEIDKNKLR